MDLQDAVAIVTGAARGIGLAIARGFAERGAKVAMVDVLGEELEHSAGELARQDGSVLPIACDITDRRQVEAMCEQVQQLGAPQVLINNAGSLSALGPVWEVDPDRWARDVTVNLIGTFNVTRAVLPAMMVRGVGYVICLVGAGVDAPHLYTTGYDSSKAGVVRLTEAIAKEAGEHGVKAFTLAPGTVWTAMTQFIAESPEGRRWRPTFRDIFAEGRDVPPDRAVAWCLRIVAGDFDTLTGRWLDGTKDPDETIGRVQQILAEERLVLRLR
jgi:NAD(P)-dependent dehydrogenase (short-subunit alcohol dehydrogenase family)